MPTFRIEVHGDARELYEVEAKDENQARAMFEVGNVLDPYLTEISGATIYSITEEP